MSHDAPTAFHAFPTRRSFLAGLRARIVATLSLLVGGLAFAVLYLAFFATHFTWYQNLAVILVDLMVVPTILVVMWVSWGVSLGRRFHDGF
jgi:hypothetical protein